MKHIITTIFLSLYSSLAIASTISLPDNINIGDVNAIEFCPGYEVDARYTFPPNGLCVNNVLYVVDYDGHSTGVRLKELKPGSYDKNVINAQCSFVVKPNCKVINKE